MRLKETLKSCVYVQGVVDAQVWRKFSPGCSNTAGAQAEQAILRESLTSMITTHIDVINVSSDKQESYILINS